MKSYTQTDAGYLNSKRVGVLAIVPILALVAVGLTVLHLSGGRLSRTGYWNIQTDWFISLNQYLSPLPQFWHNITQLGDAFVLLPALSFLIINRPQVWAALFGAIPLAAFFSLTGKKLAAVPRPAAVLDQSTFSIIGETLTEYNCLPSGHSITVFTVLTVLLTMAWCKPKQIGGLRLLTITGIGIAVAVTLCLSRVAVGAHWPLDLLVGASIGCIAGLSGVSLTQRYYGWWQWLKDPHYHFALGLAMLLWSVLLIQRTVESPSGGLIVFWLQAICGLAVSLWLIRGQGKLPMHLSTGRFVVFASLVNMIIYHIPLYLLATENLDFPSISSVLVIITLFVLVFTFTALVLIFLFIVAPILVKPFCIIIALCNSVALYFVSTYGVILDISMMESIFDTQTAQTVSYLHPKLFLYIFVFGLIPGFLLWNIPIEKTGRLYLLRHFLITIVASLCWIYINSDTWLWFDKYSKRLGGTIMPWSYLVNSIRNKARYISASQKQQLLPEATFISDEKTVVILVIGETARAQNFSLYGYERPTNPLLAESDVLVLGNSIACSTYTVASVNCMLSHDGSSSTQYELLPSYLQRQGIDVIWRTKNWGEAAITVESYQRSGELKEQCDGDGCDYDEVLLSGLAEQIQSSAKQNIFIVLHTTGSHGPAYHKKYPARFERFKPVCRSVDLSQCSGHELLNAYDNTIVYTDYFLHQTIQLLRTIQNRPSLLIYMSDHGESLGEYGLYLHGVPFSIAPKVQKYVPFIIWVSDGLKKKWQLSGAHYKQKTEYSHANIFHSILGAFDMESPVYNERMDIFATFNKKEN